ncbi:MAG: GIY-YIG nuclease family protein [bacterium]
MELFWVYVLESKKDHKRYIGYTINIDRRLKLHNSGKVISTSYRRPLELIYYEGCTNRYDAQRREKYLKTTGGRRYLAKRLKEYYKKNN